MTVPAANAKRGRKFESPGHYTDKDREKMSDSEFGDPENKKFPILNAQDVMDAAHLIGKASDPERVKARIIAIAKNHGWPIPAAWTEGADDDSDRATAEPEETREADTLTRITLPAEVRIVDAAKREFEVCATSEAMDSFGTIFSFEATKDAFLRWKRNIREMHAPLAVGRGIEVRFDDAAKKTYVRGRVSRGAESTWLKLEDGVLQGASIGASNVKWEHRVIGGKSVPVATAYDLVELSLVDNPSNPDAYGVTLVRSATPAADVWQSDQEVADEERAAFRDAAEADLAAEETRDMAGVPQLGPNVGAAPGGTPVAVTAPATSAAATATAGSTPATADAAVAAFAPGSALPSAPIAPPLPAEAQAQAQAQREMPEALRREREGKAEAAYIRLAGDRAVAEAGLDAFDPNTGTYDMYIQRVAAIRAPAEVAAMLEYRARKQKKSTAAAAAEKAPEAGAAGVATPAATDVESDDDDDDGERAAVAVAVAVAAAPEATRGSLSDTTHVIGQVQMGPRGVSSASASENLDTDRHGHVHTHAHGGDFERHGAGGTHSHVHMHLDGTEHDHPHLHDHDHGDHATLTARAAASAGGDHSHEHKHVHDHLHTFRAGTPTDARLMTPDALRAPFGSPADASDNRKPPRKGSTETGTLAVGTSAQGGEVSPILSVQPQAVGHRVLYNTEDAAALEAGVPAAAEQRPTPTGDITLNDANFHEGGHPTGAEGPDRMTHDGGPADQYDDDGDHDGGADDEPQTPARPPAAIKRQPVSRPTPGGTPSNGPSVGMGQVSGPRSAAAAAATAAAGDAIATLLAQGLISEDAAEQMRAAAGANESNMGVVHVDAGTQGAAPGADEDDDRDDYAEAEGNDGDADDVATPARPPRAMPRQSTDRPGLDVGKNPADTGLSPYLSPQRPADAAPLGKAGGLHGSSQAGARAAGSDVTVATQTRVGARISAESRQMLHSVRDQALASVKAACAHCNGSGNECPECADLMTVLNGGAFDATGDHSSDDDQQPNVQSDTALFGNLRVMTALFQRDIARGFRDLRAQYEERFAEQQALIEDLTVRLADAQLTLADHQRGYAAEVTRSVEAQMQTRMEAMTQHIQDALTDGLTTRLAPTIEQALAPLSQRVEGVAADAAGLKADVARIADQPAILGGPATGVALKRFAGESANGNGPGGQQALSADDEMAVLARFADSLPQSDMETRMKIAARQAALSAQPYALGGRGALPGAPRARR